VRIYEAIDVLSLSNWSLMDEFEARKGGGNCCISWNPSPFGAQSIVVGDDEYNVKVRAERSCCASCNAPRNAPSPSCPLVAHHSTGDFVVCLSAGVGVQRPISSMASGDRARRPQRPHPRCGLGAESRSLLPSDCVSVQRFVGVGVGTVRFNVVRFASLTPVDGVVAVLMQTTQTRQFASGRFRSNKASGARRW